MKYLLIGIFLVQTIFCLSQKIPKADTIMFRLDPDSSEQILARRKITPLYIPDQFIGMPQVVYSQNRTNDPKTTYFFPNNDVTVLHPLEHGYCAFYEELYESGNIHEVRFRIRQHDYMGPSFDGWSWQVDSLMVFYNRDTLALKSAMSETINYNSNYTWKRRDAFVYEIDLNHAEQMKTRRKYMPYFIPDTLVAKAFYRDFQKEKRIVTWYYNNNKPVIAFGKPDYQTVEKFFKSGNLNSVTFIRYLKPKIVMTEKYLEFYDEGSLIISKENSLTKNKNRSYDSKYVEYYKSGQIAHKHDSKSAEGFLSLKPINGKSRSFYENGQLKMISEYIEGKLYRVSEYYDVHGRPLDVGTFTEGNGNLRVYHDQGVHIANEIYKNGKLKKREELK